MAAADYSIFFGQLTPEQQAQNFYSMGDGRSYAQFLDAFNTIANFPGGSTVAQANLVYGDGVPAVSERYQYDPIAIADAIKSNPKQFIVDNSYDIGVMLPQINSTVFNNYLKEVSALGFDKTQVAQINDGVVAGATAINNVLQKEAEDQANKKDYWKVIGGVALSFLIPGVGSAIAEGLMASIEGLSLTVANAIGTTIASSALNIAQGQDPETAIKNALVNTAVSTGSVPLAKEVNTFIGHPAVTDALISAGASAVKTAAAGGTEQDIANNMTGALAGSAASSAYQEAGQDYTRQTGRVIGSAVAGGVTGGAQGAISGAIGELGGQAKGKVAGAIEDVISPSDTGALTPSEVAVLPNIEVAAKKLPADITSTNIISPSGTTDQKVLDLISASKAPDAVLKQVEVRAKKLPPSTDITKTDIIEPSPYLDPTVVTGTKEDVPVDVAKESVAAAEESVPSEQYDPNLFIIGGVKPKPKTPTTAPKTSTATLGQALGTTTGLTASRGAGEIEDPSTGKKRRKVWNEETLRLKDALGV